MVAHPLDPLSPTEFQSTAAILRRDQGLNDSWRFASIELKEPAKDRCQGLETGRSRPQAVAFCVVGPEDQPNLRGGRRSCR